jgi:4'-phosphopantetheinyl transferase
MLEFDVPVDWQSPPADLAIEADEVHVWRIALDQPADVVERLSAALSADERARAERIMIDGPRRRFIVSRGALREVLGRCASILPSEVRFCYGRRGKPALDLERTTLRFNLSHSGDLALIAVACGREIGVDVERIRRDRDLERIATRFFSRVEVGTLLAVPPAERVEAFYRCWTRKEAYIKAIGEGLAIPLDSFDVAFAPGAPITLLANRFDPAQAQRWLMGALEPGPGYAGAVVVEGNERARGRRFEYEIGRFAVPRSTHQHICP